MIAGVARIVVIADFIFTANAVALQPITGTLLANMVGYPILDGWIGLSIILYIVTGAFWLPVVRMQMQRAIMAVDDACRAAASAATSGIRSQGTLSISSSESRTLEVRFRGRDINELVSNDGRRKCDSSSDEAESVCHIGNPKGTVEFSWIEDL